MNRGLSVLFLLVFVPMTTVAADDGDRPGGGPPEGLELPSYPPNPYDGFLDGRENGSTMTASLPAGYLGPKGEPRDPAMPGAGPLPPQNVLSEEPDCGLQKLIDQAASRGGGVVRIPEGVFELRRGLVLRSHVQIEGAGMDKTILRPKRRPVRLEVESAEGTTIRLKQLPPELGVGSAVITWPSYPDDYYGSPRACWIKSIDRVARTIVVEAPYGMSRLGERGILSFDPAAAPDKDLKKGDTELHLKNASGFAPGDEILLGMPGNDSWIETNFVKEIRGTTLLLEEPSRANLPAWPDEATRAKLYGNYRVAHLVFGAPPMIHGWRISNAAVRDLTVKGHGMETIRCSLSRYTRSGIHFFDVSKISMERVAVRDWDADGFSIQTGSECVVRGCEATGVLGNGFHPGTALRNSVFESCVGKGNGGAGLYLCWHNDGHVLKNNTFIENRGGGITGLGNPSDRNIVIEGNLIARNGGAGIEINGDPKSGNVIRGNIIENNSRSKAGKYPGIRIGGKSATGYTVVGNTIRDTQTTPTQYVGIEEDSGGDGNIIKGNTYGGHRTADVIYHGANTVVEEPAAKVEKR